MRNGLFRPEKLWRSLGFKTARADIPIERVLVGDQDIDRIIRAGYNRERIRQVERLAAEQRGAMRATS